MHTLPFAHMKYLVPISLKLFKVATSFDAWIHYDSKPKSLQPHPINDPPQPYAYLTHNHCDSMQLDSNSSSIGFDNHATPTMSGIKGFFEDLGLRSDLGSCGEISGELQIAGVATFILKLQDDDGKDHIMKITNLFYIPGLKRTLVCHQQWAQEVNDHCPLPDGTTMETVYYGIVL